MKKKSPLRVSECFYSIQGEGPTAGCPAVFLRLSACNLMCGGKGTEVDQQLHGGATWRCDTIEVWRKGIEYEVEDLMTIPELNALRQNQARLIITGGEPLLQKEAIYSFITLLDFVSDRREIPIEIESNATISPGGDLFRRVTQWNFSPKLSNSGMPANKRIRPDVLYDIKKNIGFTKPTYFKFVVSREEDWDEIKRDWVDPGYVSMFQIVLMPAASDVKELSVNGQIVAEICKREGLRMSNRMQITIWNRLTGV